MEVPIPTQEKRNQRPLTSMPRSLSFNKKDNEPEIKPRPGTSIKPIPPKKPGLPDVFGKPSTQKTRQTSVAPRPSTGKANMDFRTILPSCTYKDKTFNKYWESTVTEPRLIEKRNNPYTNDIEPINIPQDNLRITSANRLLYKYPQVNWNTKCPVKFLSHIGGSDFNISYCETNLSSRAVTGRPTANTFNRPYTAVEKPMRERSAVLSATKRAVRPTTAMPNRLRENNREINKTDEDDLVYLIQEEELFNDQNQIKRNLKVERLLNDYQGLNVKNFSIKTAQADTDLLEIFDRSQRTLAATLAKVGDYEYYTSCQRIGSFIDYSMHVKWEDLKNIEKHITQTKNNMLCYQSKHNIQPANEIIPRVQSEYFNDPNSLFHGFMPYESEMLSINKENHPYDPIDYLPKYSSDDIYNEDLYSEEFKRNVTTSINNYNKYLDSTKIQQSDLHPFNLPLLKKKIVSRIHFTFAGLYKKILDSNMSELEKLYYETLKTIIMDYILRSPHERKRLNIIYYPTKALPSSFTIALHGSFNRNIHSDWVDNYANAFIAVERNLSLCNIAVSGLIDWTQSFSHINLIYTQKLNVLRAKEINTIHIDDFCKIEESYLNKTKRFLKDVYYRGCVLITKKNKYLKRKDVSSYGKWTFKGYIPTKEKIKDDQYGMSYEDQLSDFWTNLDFNDLIDIRLTPSNFCYVNYLLNKKINLNESDYDDLSGDAQMKLNTSITAYCSVFLRKLTEKGLNDFSNFFESFKSNELLYKMHKDEKVNFASELEYKDKELKLPEMLSFNICHLVDPVISIKTKYEPTYNLIKLEYNFDQVYEKVMKVVETLSALFNSFCSSHFLEFKKILPSGREKIAKEHSTRLNDFFNSDPNQNKSFLEEYYETLCPNLVLEEIETEHYMKTYLKIMNPNEQFLINIKSKIYRQMKEQFSEMDECLKIFDPVKEVYINSFDESIKTFLGNYNATPDYLKYTEFVDKIRRYQRYITIIPNRLSYSMFAIDLRNTKKELYSKLSDGMNSLMKSLEQEIIELYEKNIEKYTELVKLIDQKLTTPEEVVAMEKTKAKVSSELAGVTRDFDDSYKIFIYLLKIDHVFTNELIGKVEEGMIRYYKFKEDQERIEKMHKENREFLENKFKDEKKKIEDDLEEFFADINLLDNQTHITEYENVVATTAYLMDRVKPLKTRIDRNLKDEELLFDYHIGTFELYEFCVSKIEKLDLLWRNIQIFYDDRKALIHYFSEEIDLLYYIEKFTAITDKMVLNRKMLRKEEDIVGKMSRILEEDIESICNFLRITHQVIEAPRPMSDSMKEMVLKILGSKTSKTMEPACRDILFAIYSKKTKYEY